VTGLLLGLVIFYALFAYPFYVMAQKVGSANGWWAFIPILNYFLMAEIGGKELWWGVLMLIPCVNIVAFIIVSMAIAKRMGKPDWMGILMMFIPGFAYYIALG
jgi:hypothetical protein